MRERREANRGFSNESKLMKSKQTDLVPGRLPADLRQALGERGLLALALDAVQQVDWSDANSGFKGRQSFRPQMMLTLLSYCYAADICGSQNIEWAIEHNETVRYICARMFPDWLAIRRFRRQHREQLQQCLIYMFKQAWALKFDQAEVDYLGYAWFESELSQQITTVVQHRIDLAVILDGVDSDC